MDEDEAAAFETIAQRLECGHCGFVGEDVREVNFGVLNDVDFPYNSGEEQIRSLCTPCIILILDGI